MRSLILAILASLAGTACVVSSTPEPVPVEPGPLSGSVTIDWTINGQKDPDLCAQAGAQDLEITVFPAGSSAGGQTFDEACESFDSTIDLDPGDYDADAVLLDPDGRPRTTTINIPTFTILGNDNLNIPIDFPSSSFY